MYLIKLFCLGLISNILFLTSVVWAENPTSGREADILKELSALKERVKELEAHDSVSRDREKGSQKEVEETEDSSDSLDALLEDQSASRQNATNNRNTTSFIRNASRSTTIGGYASTEFENFEGRNATFDHHRLILEASAQLHKRVSFYTEIEFEHAPAISSKSSGNTQLNIADLNNNGMIEATEAVDIPIEFSAENGKGGELEIEQAWVQYDATANIGFRTGVILIPFGRFNLYHDDDLQNLTSRPLVARRVIPTTWADVGAGFVGQVNFGDESRLAGEVYVINGLDDDFSSGTGGLRGARASRESDNNNNKAVVGRVVLQPSLGQEIGVSGYYGNYDNSGNAISGIALDWLYKFSAIMFKGEYAYFALDSGVNSKGELSPRNIQGVFAELGYEFWPAFLNGTFLAEGFENPLFVLSGRYNYAAIDSRIAGSILDENSYVVGFAYKPLVSMLLKTEWQFNQGSLERGDSSGFMSSVAIGF